MNQKEKIIIVISSTLTILFIPFFNKGNLLKKNNHQHLVNNQYLPKKKKKKATIFWMFFIFFGIIIVILIIFWITKLIIPKIKKPLKEVRDIKPLDLLKYLSGNLYPVCQDKFTISVYFSPYSAPKDKISEQLFNLDINKDEKEIPLELQNVYNDLKSQKTFFHELGKAIGNFFHLLDGHLIFAIDNQKKYLNINAIFKNIQKHIYENGLSKNKFQVHWYTDYDEDRPPINIQEKETPLNFFKRAINNEHIALFQNKFVLFEHYYIILKFTESIFNELEDFFSINEKNKKKYQKYYNNYQNVINKIKGFLTFKEKKLAPK